MTGVDFLRPRRVTDIASVLVIALFVAAAGYIAFREGVWYDEACSMTSANGSLGDTLDHALHMENQPPLYFVILNGWLRLHRSIGFARLLSLASAVSAAAIVALTFGKLNRDDAAVSRLGMLILVLASPFGMYVATEARGYALQLLLGALLVWVMATSTRRGSTTTREVVVIAALGVLLSYVHYVAGLAAAVVSLALFVSRLLSVRQLATIAAAGAALTAPLWGWVRKHFQAHADSHGGPNFAGAVAALRSLCGLAIPHAVNRGSWQSAIALAVLAAVITGLVVGARRGQRPGVPKAFALAAVATVVTFVAIGLAGGEPAALERYFAAFLPLIWITTVLFMRASLGGKATAGILGILALGGFYRVLRIHQSGTRFGDWRSVAERIASDTSSAIPVFAFPPVEALALRVELGESRRVDAFPRDYDGSVAATADDYRVPDQEKLWLHVKELAGSGPFWLAYNAVPITPPEIERPLEPINLFLDRYCTVAQDFHYRESRLLKLTLRDRDR